jgi:hypothetical protein
MVILPEGGNVAGALFMAWSETHFDGTRLPDAALKVYTSHSVYILATGGCLSLYLLEGEFAKRKGEGQVLDVQKDLHRRNRPALG